MIANKIRIYDLAKELKWESKRLIEEVRREGVDVSVPSNTISRELAEKIRSKYFPKKDAPAARTVRVVKKATREVAPEETTTGDTPQMDVDLHAAPAPTIENGAVSADLRTASPVAEEIVSTTQPPPSRVLPTGARLVSKRLSPAVRAEQTTQPDSSLASSPSSQPISESNGVAEASSVAQISDETEMIPTASVSPESQASSSSNLEIADSSHIPTSPGSPAPARQVKQLRLTREALSAGMRQGERAPAPPVPASTTPAAASTPATRTRGGERFNDRRGGGPAARPTLDFASGTPGETATPQITYIPPDTRRPRSRTTRGGAAAGGGRKRFEDRGGRFDRETMHIEAKSLETRIAESLNLTSSIEGQLRPVRLVEGSTVKEFAEKLGIKPKEVVALLLQRKILATINQPLNHEDAIDLGRRFGFEVSFVPFEEMVAEEEFEELVATDADDVELPRAPVVTVMGHVDHGKTSLLDAIRTTDVAGGEAGGITQHIGAYSVNVTSPDNPLELRRVVFLDTPGHEAFTMMRARGAKATDVVVLVVAADDGVMPQTIEAIEHARAAGVPIVVAINKIDRPDANPDRVRQELAMQGLQPVEWGGETEMVLVSAKQRTNLETLLETILLTADILNLKASPTRLASGVVLEAKLDRGRGSVATVLVQQGTLRTGDPFIIGQIFGKVRAMFDDRGQAVGEAGPATPVEVLGLQGVPQAGESFQVVADVTRAQTISHHRQAVARQSALLQTTKRGIETLGQLEIKELLVILKADVQGSVEVLKSTLQKLSTAQVKVRVIRSGVGAITESDVLLASATQAGASNMAVVIIGFNVRPEVRAAELAKQEMVDVRLHSIIYKVEEEIRAAMLGMLDAIEQERVLGRALVLQVFRVPKLGAVAGCRVTEGVVRRNAQARLIRDAVVIWEGSVASLRRVKDDVSEVREGFECGIGLVNYNDIKTDDQIEVFMIEKVAATEL
jgi:translation initiation factor IF-2